MGPQPIDVQPATSAAAASSAHIPGLPPDVIIDTTSSRKASLTPAITSHRLRAHGPGYVATALSKRSRQRLHGHPQPSTTPAVQHSPDRTNRHGGQPWSLQESLCSSCQPFRGLKEAPTTPPKSAPLLSSRVSDHGWRMWWGVLAALSSPQPRAPPQPPRARSKGWHPAPDSAARGSRGRNALNPFPERKPRVGNTSFPSAALPCPSPCVSRAVPKLYPL